MAVRLSKPWMPIEDALALLRGNLGVFELADADGTVLFIGYAGGDSLYGLKGCVTEALQTVAGVSLVRFEVTTAYHTRYRELLMAYQADFAGLPPGNSPLTFKLGKLSPA
jgi:hypothetical protein